MAMLLVAVVILAVGVALLVHSVRRSWPQIRAQRERIRRAGGPRGADFDSYAADQIDRLPVPGEERHR
jgi:hypothetical protein